MYVDKCKGTPGAVDASPNYMFMQAGQVYCTNTIRESTLECKYAPKQVQLERFRFDYEYDFLDTFRFDYEYEFDYEHDFLETFRFDYEYEFDYEYDFLETFRFDYEYEFDYA